MDNLPNFEPNGYVPKVKLDQSELEFTANQIGEKLTQTITVINETPETVLEGKWSVSPHRSDPPHTPDEHSWIQISPQQFRGNQVPCQVIVDTQKLRANKDYEREIILSSNAEQENHYLKVKIRTAAPIIKAFKKPPYLVLAVIVVIGAIAGGAIAGGAIGAAIVVAIGGAIVVTIVDGMIGGMIGDMIGAIIGIATDDTTDDTISSPNIFAIVVAIVAQIVTAIVLVTVIATVIAISKVIRKKLNKFDERGFNQGVAWLYILLSYGLGISIGIAKVIGLSPYIILALAATGLPLGGMLIYNHLIIQRRLTAQYHRHEAQNLIEP